jgi:hypothetical protein
LVIAAESLRDGNEALDPEGFDVLVRSAPRRRVGGVGRPAGGMQHYLGSGGAKTAGAASRRRGRSSPALIRRAHYNGLDYTRPQQNADLRLQFRTSSSPTTQTERELLYLRLTTKIDLPADWQLGLRARQRLSARKRRAPLRRAPPARPD